MHGFLVLFAVVSVGALTGPSEPEIVHFKRPKGVVLEAAYHRGGPTPKDRRPAVILLHQAGSSRQEWDFIVPELLGLGYRVLALDLRGHGASTPAAKDKRSFYPKLFTDPLLAPADLTVVIDWLRVRRDVDYSRIAIIGGSVGANLAISAAVRKEVRTAVALSGHNENAQKLAGNPASFAPRRVFYIAAAGEPGRVNHAEALYAASQYPKRVAVLAGSDAHGASILKEDRRLGKAVLAWLEENLSKP